MDRDRSGLNKIEVEQKRPNGLN